MTCLECLYWDVCRGKYHPIQGWVEIYCRHFKKKTDYAEVKHGIKAESAISSTGLMCTVCYSDIDRDAVFCKYCGAIMDGSVRSDGQFKG